MHYVGKDVIHWGCGLDLDPAKVAAELPHSARKNVRKAERAGFDIRRVAGTPEDLAELRPLWYLPEDPNFPEQVGADDVVYFAYLDGELCGGMVLLRVGSHYFLNNLTANEAGKQHQLQGYLLWHAVHDLAGGECRYIDVGVSYRPNLQRFFEKWSTFRYPVLFHAPAIVARIDFHPFQELGQWEPGAASPASVDRFCLNRPYTLVPSAEWAERIVAELSLPAEQVPAPRADRDVQWVDLTRLLPVQHGAVLIGIDVPAQTLWDRFGCFDFVKTEYLRGCLARAADELEDIRTRRLALHARLEDALATEDLQLAPAEEFPVGVELATRDPEALERRFEAFGIAVERTSDGLRLPCHQNLRPEYATYVRAIYRGWLNQCSEWVPTRVRGSLKMTAAT